jgi:hypothetical protein
MSKERTVASLVQENKKILIIFAVVLFLIELEIFAIAVMKSGRKSWLQILDQKGNVIHETDGNNLSEFNKYYFEKTFGPFENYEVRRVTKEYPFPFRAWFVAALGIPIGVILLFAFVVKAYTSLFYGEGQKAQVSSEFQPEAGSETGLERLLSRLSQFNIFSIGFLIFFAVFLYWVIPNFVTYMGRIGVETLIRFKWIFLSAALIVLGVFIWVIYLRYLLAKKSIDSRAEIEKHRLQLEYRHAKKVPLQLDYSNPQKEDRPLVKWDETVQDQNGQESPGGSERKSQDS